MMVRPYLLCFYSRCYNITALVCVSNVILQFIHHNHKHIANNFVYFSIFLFQKKAAAKPMKTAMKMM